MSGFSIDWLDLRDSADRRARDPALLEQARQWLSSSSTGASLATVVDLGAGTGATLRAFNAAGDSLSVQWRLVDHDAGLLAEARRRHGDTHRLETVARDLTALDSLPLQGAQLVTTSALFDLVSSDFIETLADAMTQGKQSQLPGLYSALNYDGTTTWLPAHPLDEEVLAAFNRDQQRDKGFGPALGPDSGRFLEQTLGNRGFQVATASTPWELSGDDQTLVQALIHGIADAVRSDPSLESEALQDWQAFRLAQAGSGNCIVGHLDILALPEN